MSKVLKIAITGGPCAGKTTVLKKIKEEYEQKGYAVYIISETATDLINSGIRPFSPQGIPLIDFQRFVLREQLRKEKLYDEECEKQSLESIILCDRGLLDNKAYLTDEEFKLIRLEQGILSEDELLDQYDAVIHMVTAAVDAIDAYTTSNNGARTESLDEARRLDERTKMCWINHPNLRVIENKEGGFDQKQDKVLQTIDEVLEEKKKNKGKKLLR